MAKQSRPNTSTRQTSRLSNRRMGIAAAVLALCLLIIGSFSLQDQSPLLGDEDRKPQTEKEAIPEKRKGFKVPPLRWRKKSLRDRKSTR
ncbi:MAG: hypothetical protein AAGD28_32565, partial [Bacteroidota bacterium]